MNYREIGEIKSEDDRVYKDILDNLYDGVYIVDHDRVISYWNKGAERITGYTNQQVIGSSCRDNLLNHVTAEGVELCANHCPLAACMKDGKVREADLFLHHANGNRIPTTVRAAPMRNAKGEIIGSVETFSIDTGIRTVRQELRKLRNSVQTDKLTGIASREYIKGRLHAAIAELAYRKSAKTAVLFIDIDSFKLINDTYGHAVGDKVLQMVTSTLKHNLRESDVVGRWGGEEFLVILSDVVGRESLKLISEKLRKLVEASRLDLENLSLSTTISMGATRLLPEDTPETIVRRADELMYQSKAAGRNQVNLG